MKESDSADIVQPPAASGFRIVQHPVHGFCHLDPIPPAAELSEFYQSRYYDLLRKGNRAPDLRRILEGGPAAARELEWLRKGLHTDILEILRETSPGSRLLEVGCGTGDFLAFAHEHHFEVTGTEPAADVARRARERGLNVHALTMENFVAQNRAAAFDTVIMLNVLEHVPDAIGALEQCRQLLTPGGILCVRVPNDFSEIQAAARDQIGSDPWWIAIPDHINYFNFETLENTLVHLGFEIVYTQGDFPMEMFLLMGERYVGDPEVGGRCHARRVQFDLSLPPKLRRKIYSSLARAGVGRECLVFARNTNSIGRTNPRQTRTSATRRQAT